MYKDNKRTQRLMVTFLWAVLTWMPVSLYSQKRGVLVIKGQDLSLTSSSIQIFRGGLLKDSIYTIPVQNGSFYALLDVDEGTQQVAVLIGKRPVSFYAVSGDAVDITFDFSKSILLKITGQDTLKTQQLRYDVSTYVKSKTDSIFKYHIGKAKDDAEKYKMCSYYYNKELDALLDNKRLIAQNLEMYINELYFSFASKMATVYQLFHIERLIGTNNRSQVEEGILPEANHFQLMSKNTFLMSPAYRQYLFNSIRFNRADSTEVQLMNKFSGDVKKAAPWKEYQKAVYVNEPFIKDWFKAKSVLFSFNHYNTEEAGEVMKLFLTECTNDMLIEKLSNMVKGFAYLRKGSKAPMIVLKNDRGKKVSLSDFTGKVVYLNFWGVHCGACITEIKDEFPLLRKEYKDLIIINICIEGKTSEWKNIINKYKMTDVNLFDDLNKATRDYNISSLPHNVLIDKQGKIVEYNAAHPNIYVQSNDAIGTLIRE